MKKWWRCIKSSAGRINEISTKSDIVYGYLTFSDYKYGTEAWKFFPDGYFDIFFNDMIIHNRKFDPIRGRLILYSIRHYFEIGKILVFTKRGYRIYLDIKEKRKN